MAQACQATEVWVDAAAKTSSLAGQAQVAEETEWLANICESTFDSALTVDETQRIPYKDMLSI